MKNCIVIIACLLIAATANKVTAQQACDALVAGQIPSLSLTGGFNRIQTKVMRDFLNRNEAATNVEWMPEDKACVVKYRDAGNLFCRTVYNSRGHYVYTIKQYGEDKMDAEVRGLVKSRYYDYTITLVEEVQMPSKPVVYIVHVQDAHTLKNIRVSEGYVEVIEDYVRQ